MYEFDRSTPVTVALRTRAGLSFDRAHDPAGVALRVRSIQGGPLMQFPTFLGLFLAPVYVPLDLLSGWIHAIASINPITALLEAGRPFARKRRKP